MRKHFFGNVWGAHANSLYTELSNQDAVLSEQERRPLGAALAKPLNLKNILRVTWFPRNGPLRVFLARVQTNINHFPFKMAQGSPNHPPPQPKVQCNLTGRMFLITAHICVASKVGSTGCIRIALDLCWNILNAHTFRFETHFRQFLLSFSRTFPIPPDPWPDPKHSPSTWFDRCQPDSAIYIDRKSVV